MTPVEKFLHELIALRSVNPAFLPVGDSRAGEHRVSDFLSASGKKAGLDVELQQVSPNRCNTLLRLRPANRIKQRIILAPHMDTVGAATMPDSMFRPVRKGERIHGRGACDTKGSVAAMFEALRTIAKSSNRPRHTEIALVAFVDEENGQRGSRALVKSGFKADLAIVGEPTQLQIVTAHKGDLWLRLRTRGKAAHGARPELGKNAVHEMARVVDALETDYAAMLRKRRHPILGSPTVNVGSIAGGTQPNIVPASCAISVDRRTIPGESEALVRREITSLLKQLGLHAEIENSKEAACLPMETSTRLPLVQQLLKIAHQKKPIGVDFFCDAAVLAAGGIPSVVFGPGDIAQAHTSDEWISVRSLESARRLLTRFLQSLP